MMRPIFVFAALTFLPATLAAAQTASGPYLAAEIVFDEAAGKCTNASTTASLRVPSFADVNESPDFASRLRALGATRVWLSDPVNVTYGRYVLAYDVRQERALPTPADERLAVYCIGTPPVVRGGFTFDAPVNAGRACGNGIQEPGETCDWGPANGRSGACRADCRGFFELDTPAASGCGDGLRQRGELCDFGPFNGVYSPGCTATCSVQGLSDWRGLNNALFPFDVNYDGVVDEADRALVDSLQGATATTSGAFLPSGTTPTSVARPDVDENGVVDDADLQLIDKWLQGEWPRKYGL